jgi:hypothetical protein
VIPNSGSKLCKYNTALQLTNTNYFIAINKLNSPLKSEWYGSYSLPSQPTQTCTTWVINIWPRCCPFYGEWCKSLLNRITFSKKTEPQIFRPQHIIPVTLFCLTTPGTSQLGWKRLPMWQLDMSSKPLKSHSLLRGCEQYQGYFTNLNQSFNGNICGLWRPKLRKTETWECTMWNLKIVSFESTEA